MSETPASSAISSADHAATDTAPQGLAGPARFALVWATWALALCLAWLAWDWPQTDDPLIDPAQRMALWLEHSRLVRYALTLGAGVLALSAWAWYSGWFRSSVGQTRPRSHGPGPTAGPAPGEPVQATPVAATVSVPSREAGAGEQHASPGREAALQRITQAMAQATPGNGLALLFVAFETLSAPDPDADAGAAQRLQEALALRLRKALRPADMLCAVDSVLLGAAPRLPGEWLVLLDNVGTQLHVQTVATRLALAAVEPLCLPGARWRGEARIGVALWPDGGDGAADAGAEALLRNADTALYAARQTASKVCMFYQAALRDAVAKSVQHENDLRRGLQAAELVLSYQPVFALAGGGLVGVEAHVVWDHPLRGKLALRELVDPDDDSGLLAEVGRQMLRQACTDFAAWRDELGRQAPQQLWLSLGAAQLRRDDAVVGLQALLAELGLDPRCLQLGVRESLAAQDDRVQSCLQGLRALGVKLALDHFGTGYSSLARLHQLPVDAVRIDAFFVRQLEHMADHRLLIEAIIRVARTRDIVTVATGLQTEGQCQVLRELGCDLAQGEHLGPVLPARGVAAWCASAQPAPAMSPGRKGRKGRQGTD